MPVSRRAFIGSALAASLAATLEGQNSGASGAVGTGRKPIIISAFNGLNYLDDAYAFLKSGGDTLDAALRVVKGPEDDPNDTSVGLGGLPNEEGVVELDEERKAAMVSNLLVVLCSEQATQQVVNTGSLYQ